MKRGIHKLAFLSSGLLTAGLLSGCGPNCQSTCEKLYVESQCNTERPGRTSDDLIGMCNDYCEGALDEVGEAGDYNPYERQGSSSSIQLENEIQAAIWMDCVAEMSCEKIADGYCAPVW